MFNERIDGLIGIGIQIDDISGLVYYKPSCRTVCFGGGGGGGSSSSSSSSSKGGGGGTLPPGGIGFFPAGGSFSFSPITGVTPSGLTGVNAPVAGPSVFSPSVSYGGGSLAAPVSPSYYSNVLAAAYAPASAPAPAPVSPSYYSNVLAAAYAPAAMAAPAGMDILGLGGLSPLGSPSQQASAVPSSMANALKGGSLAVSSFGKNLLMAWNQPLGVQPALAQGLAKQAPAGMDILGLSGLNLGLVGKAAPAIPTGKVAAGQGYVSVTPAGLATYSAAKAAGATYVPGQGYVTPSQAANVNFNVTESDKVGGGTEKSAAALYNSDRVTQEERDAAPIYQAVIEGRAAGIYTPDQIAAAVKVVSLSPNFYNFGSGSRNFLGRSLFGEGKMSISQAQISGLVPRGASSLSEWADLLATLGYLSPTLTPYPTSRPGVWDIGSTLPLSDRIALAKAYGVTADMKTNPQGWRNQTVALNTVEIGGKLYWMYGPSETDQLMAAYPGLPMWMAEVATGQTKGDVLSMPGYAAHAAEWSKQAPVQEAAMGAPWSQSLEQFALMAAPGNPLASPEMVAAGLAKVARMEAARLALVAPTALGLHEPIFGKGESAITSLFGKKAEGPAAPAIPAVPAVGALSFNWNSGFVGKVNSYNVDPATGMVSYNEWGGLSDNPKLATGSSPLYRDVNGNIAFCTSNGCRTLNPSDPSDKKTLDNISKKNVPIMSYADYEKANPMVVPPAGVPEKAPSAAVQPSGLVWVTPTLGSVPGSLLNANVHGILSKPSFPAGMALKEKNFNDIVGTDYKTGKTVSLNDTLASGKHVLLSIGDTFCGACIGNTKVLQDFQNKYGADNVVVMDIWPASQADRVVSLEGKFGSDVNFSSVVLVDNWKDISSKFHIIGTPTNVKIAPDGSIENVFPVSRFGSVSDVEKFMGVQPATGGTSMLPGGSKVGELLAQQNIYQPQLMTIAPPTNPLVSFWRNITPWKEEKDETFPSAVSGWLGGIGKAMGGIVGYEPGGEDVIRARLATTYGPGTVAAAEEAKYSLLADKPGLAPTAVDRTFAIQYNENPTKVALIPIKTIVDNKEVVTYKADFTGGAIPRTHSQEIFVADKEIAGLAKTLEVGTISNPREYSYQDDKGNAVTVKKGEPIYVGNAKEYNTLLDAGDNIKEISSKYGVFDANGNMTDWKEGTPESTVNNFNSLVTDFNARSDALQSLASGKGGDILAKIEAINAKVAKARSFQTLVGNVGIITTTAFTPWVPALGSAFGATVGRIPIGKGLTVSTGLAKAGEIIVSKLPKPYYARPTFELPGVKVPYPEIPVQQLPMKSIFEQAGIKPTAGSIFDLPGGPGTWKYTLSSKGYGTPVYQMEEYVPAIHAELFEGLMKGSAWSKPSDAMKFLAQNIREHGHEWWIKGSPEKLTKAGWQIAEVPVEGGVQKIAYHPEFLYQSRTSLVDIATGQKVPLMYHGRGAWGLSQGTLPEMFPEIKATIDFNKDFMTMIRGTPPTGVITGPDAAGALHFPLARGTTIAVAEPVPIPSIVGGPTSANWQQFLVPRVTSAAPVAATGGVATTQFGSLPLLMSASLGLPAVAALPSLAPTPYRMPTPSPVRLPTTTTVEAPELIPGFIFDPFTREAVSPYWQRFIQPFGTPWQKPAIDVAQTTRTIPFTTQITATAPLTQPQLMTLPRFNTTPFIPTPSIPTTPTIPPVPTIPPAGFPGKPPIVPPVVPLLGLPGLAPGGPTTGGGIASLLRGEKWIRPELIVVIQNPLAGTKIKRRISKEKRTPYGAKQAGASGIRKGQ